MKIEHIYVAGHEGDLRYTQCCVASIRRWYPEMPISLVKDELRGAYGTRELEEAWDVSLFEGERPVPSGPWGKLEPLFLPGRRRCLILDSDIVFIGKVIESLEAVHADFVVEPWGSPAEHLARSYFDLAALKELDPDFVFPGRTFNAGQFVGTTGILRRRDFEPFVRFGDSPQMIQPEIFTGNDQGVLNYVLLKKAQVGELTLERLPFMLWAGSHPRRKVHTWKLTARSPYPYLVHWAGPKRKIFWRVRCGRLLRHFEACYYTRIPGGRRERLRRSTRLLWAVATGKESSTTKPPPPVGAVAS